MAATENATASEIVEARKNPPRGDWVAAGSVLGAVLASACCVVPLLFVTLGISGAWIANLTALEPYKPYVATVTLGLIGLAAIMSVQAFSPSAAQPASARIANVEKRTFAVDNMTCALCPVTVKKAMQRVDGVRSVDVDFNAKTATVVFDPAVATADAIAAASTNAGYPARLARQGN